MKVLVDVNHLTSIIHDLVNVAQILQTNAQKNCEHCHKCEEVNRKLGVRLVNLRNELLQSIKAKKDE